MARVTIERINDKCDNIFELVVLASYRAHEIDCCQKSLADADNKFAVMALREIEQDKIDLAQLKNTVIQKYVLEMETNFIKNSFVINDYSPQNIEEEEEEKESNEQINFKNNSKQSSKFSMGVDKNFFAD